MAEKVAVKQTTVARPTYHWGAAAIGRTINKTPRQTFYMLEKGLLPARKVGDQWVASDEALAAYLEGGLSKVGTV